MISRIHVDFRGVYGYRRVHAELTLGHGVTVGTEAVWLLMRSAGLQGISGRPRYRRTLLTDPSAGLIGRAGAPPLTISTVGVVTAVALGVAVAATLVPAVRAARTSTVSRWPTRPAHIDARRG